LIDCRITIVEKLLRDHKIVITGTVWLIASARSVNWRVL